MVDGITGSGKSTILKAVHEWAQESGFRIFHLRDWSNEEPPQFETLREFDIYFTYEPTRTWVGAAIRYELSREDEPYGGEELAHAFALDRQINYRRFIIPALREGKTIIQDRGVSSSLVYQPIMPQSVPLETVMALPGNTLALHHAPDALILTKLPAQVAYERLEQRDEESKGVFTHLTFLQKQEERFASEWLKNIFTSHGTRVYELDTSQTLEESQRQARKLIERILNDYA